MGFNETRCNNIDRHKSAILNIQKKQNSLPGEKTK
jgi:hypothetical protein